MRPRPRTRAASSPLGRTSAYATALSREADGKVHGRLPCAPLRSDQREVPVPPTGRERAPGRTTGGGPRTGARRTIEQETRERFAGGKQWHPRRRAPRCASPALGRKRGIFRRTSRMMVAREGWEAMAEPSASLYMREPPGCSGRVAYSTEASPEVAHPALPGIVGQPRRSSPTRVNYELFKTD